jgi:hypothetical protein
VDVKEDIMSKTREEKIEIMLDAVDNWDVASMVDFIKCHMQLSFDDMSDKEINREYKLSTDERTLS